MSTNQDSCKLERGNCKPCQGGIDPLGPDQIESYLIQLPDWSVLDYKKIQKNFKFKNFRSALTFTNLVGQLAEQQQHHPDILLTWGNVTVTLWTHKIGGLHENDFILAAKIDQLQQSKET